MVCRLIFAGSAGTALKNVTEEDFSKHFQITSENPMIGVPSRVRLLNAVGEQISNNKAGVFKDNRIGTIVGRLPSNIPLQLFAFLFLDSS